jgi:hypothetical protein
MHVTITCPVCEVSGRVRRKYAGRWVSCRRCAHAFRMPPLDDPVARLLHRRSSSQNPAKSKTVTRVDGGKDAQLGELRRLAVLLEQGIITPWEYERLRRQARGQPECEG